VNKNVSAQRKFSFTCVHCTIVRNNTRCLEVCSTQQNWLCLSRA